MIRYKRRSSMRHGSRCSRMISGAIKRTALANSFHHACEAEPRSSGAMLMSDCELRAGNHLPSFSRFPGFVAQDATEPSLLALRDS